MRTARFRGGLGRDCDKPRCTQEARRKKTCSLELTPGPIFPLSDYLQLTTWGGLLAFAFGLRTTSRRDRLVSRAGLDTSSEQKLTDISTPNIRGDLF